MSTTASQDSSPSRGTAFLQEYFAERRGNRDEIPADLDLIENRILDSLAFTEFLYRLEEVTGREIRLEEVSAADFRTINTIIGRFFT